MAKKVMPFVPMKLLRYPLATDAIVEQVESPILFVHGDEDALIPYQHAETLYNRALKVNPAVKLALIKGAAHNDIHDFDQYNQTLAEALP